VFRVAVALRAVSWVSRSREESMRLGGFVVAGFVLLVVVGVARADGGFMPPWDFSGADLREPSQRAVLIQREQTESLLLFVDYEGTAEQFAWVVPTPTRPEVTIAEPAIFVEVAEYYQHLRMKAWEASLAEQQDDDLGLPEARGRGVGPPAEDVTLHESRDLGPYEISVLSATTGGGLRQWLADHGYRVPAQVDDVLEAYVTEGWTFTAVKVGIAPGGVATLQPLRLDFATERPVYPLRISAATPGVTDVRMYFIREGAERPIAAGPGDAGFRGGDELVTMCPTLAAAFPGLAAEPFAIVRLQQQFVPQILREMDDHVHETPRGNRDILSFGSPDSAARACGLALALVSDDPAEAEWARDELSYYAYSTPRHGGPSEHARADEIRRVTAPVRTELRDLLFQHIDHFRTVPGGHVGMHIEGALLLAVYSADPSDEVLVHYLERGVPGASLSHSDVDRLRDLGSPTSRRALARLALAPERDEGDRRIAAFRLLMSLGENPIHDDERRTVAREIVAIGRSEVLPSTSLESALGLLEDYTDQEMGEDWAAWDDWLESDAEVVRWRDPDQVLTEAEARACSEEWLDGWDRRGWFGPEVSEIVHEESLHAYRVRFGVRQGAEPEPGTIGLEVYFGAKSCRAGLPVFVVDRRP